MIVTGAGGSHGHTEPSKNIHFRLGMLYRAGIAALVASPAMTSCSEQ